MKIQNATRLIAVSFICCLALLALLAPQVQAQDPFLLRDGDRIVFYGDDITEVQFYDNVAEPRLYTTFIETYAVTRFPKLQLEFINSAWGGDRVTGGYGGPADVRLQRDVIAYKPTVLSIMLGMRDAGGTSYDSERAAAFATGYEHIVRVVRGALPSVRITAVEPSAYDENGGPPLVEGGYNSVLLRYGEIIRKIAERERLTVADLNSPLLAFLQTAQTTDPAMARGILPDRAHPGPGGHLVLATALLKAWDAPMIVSAVEIDAAHRRIVRADKTSVLSLTIDHGLSWTQEDQALPFPIDVADPAIALAVRCSDVVEALDQQTLKVTGLTAERYLLKIDREPIATFARGQLEQGVNLALLDTPMKKQAMQVHRLTLRRNDVHFGQWRQTQVPQGILYKELVGHALLNADTVPPLWHVEDDSPRLTSAAINALDKLEQDVIQRQRSAAQPRPHHYEVIPEP
jgi:hypothetical protein